MTVLASQRQERILDRVTQQGAARVAELVEFLGVSDMTIRRDIETLAGRGLVERVHGGVMALGGRSTEEPGFLAKSELRTAEKLQIARAAAALVEPGSAVAISGGTTTFAVARELRVVPDLTVVTNSVPVGQLLHEDRRCDLTVILTGGVRTPSDALVGPVAVRSLCGLHVDWLFLGVHGIEPVAGLTTPNLVEADTNRALVACARRVAVAVDSSKWGVIGLSTIAPLDEVDVLVTDRGLPLPAQEAVRSRIERLVLADPHHGTAETISASAPTISGRP